MSSAARTAKPPIQELVSLDGRCAGITGGARGLGFAIGERFAEAGARVALVDVDAEAGLDAARKLTGAHAPGVAIAADLGTTEGAEAAVDDVVQRLGRVDIWVNNAGIYPFTALGQVTATEWDRIVDVNLRGAFFAAQAAGQRMIAQGGGGVILNISSISGFRAVGNNVAVYAATKTAIVGLTRNLALELGHHGIRVVAIAPGFTVTEGITARSADQRQGADNARMQEQVLERQPLKRMCEPDDIARTALFCASDMASFITGHTIPVDGGLLTH
jgi:NAD(P)-dependent dehydrogenase (short-subunit alcohol dehydrogenase family)